MNHQQSLNKNKKMEQRSLVHAARMLFNMGGDTSRSEQEEVTEGRGDKLPTLPQVTKHKHPEHFNSSHLQAMIKTEMKKEHEFSSFIIASQAKPEVFVRASQSILKKTSVNERNYEKVDRLRNSLASLLKVYQASEIHDLMESMNREERILIIEALLHSGNK